MHVRNDFLIWQFLVNSHGVLFTRNVKIVFLDGTKTPRSGTRTIDLPHKNTRKKRNQREAGIVLKFLRLDDYAHLYLLFCCRLHQSGGGERLIFFNAVWGLGHGSFCFCPVLSSCGLGRGTSRFFRGSVASPRYGSISWVLIHICLRCCCCCCFAG